MATVSNATPAPTRAGGWLNRVLGLWQGLYALLGGQTLGGALDQAQKLNIGDWLPMAVQTGLLLSVRLTDRDIQKTGVD